MFILEEDNIYVISFIKNYFLFKTTIKISTLGLTLSFLNSIFNNVLKYNNQKKFKNYLGCFLNEI